MKFPISRSTASTVFYAPGDWLCTKLNRRQRVALATWFLILYVATIPLRFPFKDLVWMVWLLSEIAIMLSLLGVVSAETPVEREEDVEISN
jgi:hypothetical protein